MAQLERLELVTRKVFRGRMKGERRSKRKGQSVEFADFRGYVPGDDLRSLDWNLYARLDKLIVKLFLEEEDLHFFTLIDASLSMEFGNPTKLQYAKQLAAALARIEDLERQLAAARKDSSTSSKPPSSDIVKPPRPLTKSRTRRRTKPRRGGQPGHPRHERSPFPAEKVDKIWIYEWPESSLTSDWKALEEFHTPRAGGPGPQALRGDRASRGCIFIARRARCSRRLGPRRSRVPAWWVRGCRHSSPIRRAPAT